MTTETPHPTPVGPAALDPALAGSAPTGPAPIIPFPVGPAPSAPDRRPTAPLEPAAGEPALDGLPLLDHHNRERTIPPRLALRGDYLAFADGDETRLLPLGQNVTHLGRGSGADIRLDEHRVSRDHAILIRHGRRFRLLDNRSSNGTFVNGRRIVATNISGGDMIEIGPVAMRFVVVL